MGVRQVRPLQSLKQNQTHTTERGPQRGWNYFWEVLKERGLSCTPLLRLMSPGGFHDGWQVKAG